LNLVYKYIKTGLGRLPDKNNKKCGQGSRPNYQIIKNTHEEHTKWNSGVAIKRIQAVKDLVHKQL
jgi:hypothetical protein